jgi:hypothetical protein
VVLDPGDRDAFPARLLDQALDVRDHGIALVSSFDDAVLDVDDEKRRVGPVLECRHRGV